MPVPPVPLQPPFDHRDGGLPCPVCGVYLVMSDRQGIEIDYCPKCRGIWLNRGELDKIIDLSLRQTSGPADAGRPDTPGYPAAASGYAADPYGHFDGDRHSGGHGKSSHGGHHGGGHGSSSHGGRRKSWLRDLFD